MFEARAARRGRPLTGRAASASLLMVVATLGVAACASDGTTAERAGGKHVDPAAALRAALDPLRPAYDFEARVTVGGQVVTEARGRVVGTGAQALVEQGPAAIEYVRVPPDAWAREPDGEWLPVESALPVLDPLGALATPTSLDLVSSSGTGVRLRAVYAATALGLSGNPMTVEVSLRPGKDVTFRYTSEVGGKPASSVTVARAAADPSPVTAPPAPPPA